MIGYKCYTGCPPTAPCELAWFASPCICTVASSGTQQAVASSNGGRHSKKTEHEHRE